MAAQVARADHLVLMHGKKTRVEAGKLYAKATSRERQDAMRGLEEEAEAAPFA